MSEEFINVHPDLSNPYPEPEPEHDAPEEIDIIGDEQGKEHPADETEIQAQDYDLFAVLHRIENKIDAQAATTDGLRNGVNTIGEMMNAVAETFDQTMKKVQSGGIGALLGGMMGGKNDG